MDDTKEDRSIQLRVVNYTSHREPDQSSTGPRMNETSYSGWKGLNESSGGVLNV